MQPPPDAVAEFKVVTNNMSAEYGRSAGATINVAYNSGTNQFRGAAWEFSATPTFNATGFFKPATGEAAASTATSSAACSAARSLKNRAFFFTDYEGFRQDARDSRRPSTIPTLAQRQGILGVDVRNPLTGAIYPAGHADPDDRLRAQGADRAAGADQRRHREQLRQSCSSFANDTDKAGGKVDVTVSPALSLFGRYRLARRRHLRPPADPAALGRRRQRPHLRRRTSSSRPARPGCRGRPRCSSSASAGRTPTAGKNPPALGSRRRRRAYGITGLPDDPRVAGGLPTQLITGYSDLGRQATNPQWQYPTVFNPKVNYTWLERRHSLKTGYEFQHIATEVQDVNPLYGRDQYAGQFTPAGRAAAANNLYNLADFMFGLRRPYALTNFFVANLRQNMHFGYVQDDWRVNDQLTLNLGLRYEYATPWSRTTTSSPTSIPRPRTMVPASDGSLKDRSTLKPDRNNFGPRLGLRLDTDRRRGRWSRGGYGISYIHFHRAGGANVLPINGPQVINAVVCRPTGIEPPSAPREQGYPAGLTDPSRFNPLPANITYMPRRLPLEPACRAGSSPCSASSAANVLVDLAYVGNRADDLLLFANYNQARAEQRRRHDPAAGAPADPRVRRHHLLVQRRLLALPRLPGASSTGGWRGAHVPQLADAVADQGQRRRLAREPERQLPRAAGLLQPRRRVRRCPPTTSRRTAPPASSGTCRSAAAAASWATRRWRSIRCSAAGSSPAINSIYAGRAGHLPLHARGGVPGVGHPAGLPRRQQLPAQRHRRSAGARDAAARRRTTSNRDTWSSRPTPASRSATPSATPCAGRCSGGSTSRPPRSSPMPWLAGRRSSCASRRSTS